MAEIFLSAAINVLVEKLLSPENFINYFAQREGVETAVKKWKHMLSKIQAVLSDAEEKQITELVIKEWLNDLRDLAYDVEDVLDEFSTDVLRRKLLEEPQASTSKLRSLIPSCCTSFKPSAVMFNFNMESKIEEITSRLQEIEKQKGTLGLREISGGASNRTKERRASQLTSSLPETHVYGREKDKEAILQLLLGSEASDGGLCEIPIIGMGGLGKTTLTQLVYNDAKVNSHFDTKAWVCVSQQFDLVRVTKEILQDFTSQSFNVDNFNSLQVSLKKELFQKKFLLVLDDVWHENYEDWTKLRRPLEVGAPGSKIIFTTRIQAISKIMGNVSRPYHLGLLSNDDCLSMFAQHALGAKDFDSYPNFKRTGEEIVKKCKGLPLAAKALGGHLRTKVNLDEWEVVLNSKIWDLPEENCGIIPALRLSYYHLPPHLKQCFTYCSIFPEDYEFEEEELIRLWMAIGLVQQQSQGKQMEDIGSVYFRDLLSRSFFQLSSINESRFVMHDLIKDLAQWVAGETFFRVEGQKLGEISKKVRYSSFVGSYYHGIKRFEAFNQVKKLRTFQALKTPDHSYLTSYVPLSLLPELRCLRVLSLRNYRITALPDSLGDLKQLRYLDFSESRIVCLPESTSTLYNLQTLILKNCFRLKKLPIAIENLINLRLLDFTNANSIKEMPPRVGKLTSLRKLSNFIVGDDSGSRIRELMNLKHLRGTLCISRLENVIDARDARGASLKDKQDLNGLTMGWSSEFKDSRNEEAEKEVLDVLQPHKKLKELTIKWYCGIIFPTWVGDSSFSNMVLMRLENCLKCTSLPPLGQLLSLKDLFIRGMSGVTTVGIEFYGKSLTKPFPLLETLSFEEMPEWNDWFPSGVDGHIEAVFSSLKKLSIRSCPKLLGSLPSHLPSLEELIIGGIGPRCEQLTVSISSFPKLCKLDIQGCEEVLYRSTEGLSALKSMVLSNISKFTCLTAQGLTNLEELKIVGCDELTSLWRKEVGLLQNLTSLHRLEIRLCPKFVSLVGNEEEELQQQQEQGLPCSRLESLKVRGCKNLEKLQGLDSLTFLKKLKIEWCKNLEKLQGLDSLTSLQKLKIKGSENLEKLQGLDSLTSLKKLTIKRCPRLVSVLETGLMHSPDYAFLEELWIRKCDSLPTLSSRGELPASLKRLCVEFCPKLGSVADRLHNNTSLEELSIGNCDSLTTLSSRGELPASLKRLSIWGCPKLGSVADRLHNNTSLEGIRIRYCESLKSLPEGLQNLNHLSEFSIDRCPNLVSFSNGGCSAANLRSLDIMDCIKLDALPDFASLQELRISNCPGMVCFPKDSGFLTNLTSLRIDNLKMWKSLIEWGLHRLTSLQDLSIEEGCPDTVSFPEEENGMILPTSLTKLSLENFSNLEYLSYKGFQNLTSLEWLSIKNCPKLQSFPEEGLPPSLLQLYISKCPLLKERCKKDSGLEWPKIALIPLVWIDGNSIYQEGIEFDVTKRKWRGREDM